MPVTPDTTLHCGGLCRRVTNGVAAACCGLCPLAVFYNALSQPLPVVEELAATDLPQPYRHLLVHQRDMTSTLQKHYGARTHLRVLQNQVDNGLYQREVVLLLDGSNQPVEFGAITIEFAVLPAAACQAVLAARWPLGGILSEHRVEFMSHPKAFFRMESDAVINQALGLTGAVTLFGRCNALRDADGNTIADIVEILPPDARAVAEK